MPSNPSPSGRPAPVSRGVLTALVLVLVAGFGTWYLTRPAAPASQASLKDLPQGKLLGVLELKNYEPQLSEVQQRLLRDGPDGASKASVKAYLLAKAQLEPDPLMRTQLEQEAVILTDGYGQTPAITEKSPQVRSVLDALKDGNHPERLNPLVLPAPFDPVAYKANSRAYLDVVEPGRVLQSKPYATDVPHLAPISPYFQNVKQGESVEIAVKSTPGFPVTFTSFDCGAFSNGLTSMTVEADAAGVAKVLFKGMPGTVLEANILAASPMASGRVSFKANTLVYSNTVITSTK